MSEDRSRAKHVIDQARKHITVERGPQHGDVEPSFRMIGELWSTYVNHSIESATGIPPVPPVHLSAADVAEMMSLMKRPRRMYGDSTLSDHYEDDIGYTALAAMLNFAGDDISREVLPNPTAKKEEKE